MHRYRSLQTDKVGASRRPSNAFVFLKIPVGALCQTTEGGNGRRDRELAEPWIERPHGTSRNLRLRTYLTGPSRWNSSMRSTLETEPHSAKSPTHIAKEPNHGHNHTREPSLPLPASLTRTWRGKADADQQGRRGPLRRRPRPGRPRLLRRTGAPRGARLREAHGLQGRTSVCHRDAGRRGRPAARRDRQPLRQRQGEGKAVEAQGREVGEAGQAPSHRHGGACCRARTCGARGRDAVSGTRPRAGDLCPGGSVCEARARAAR